jgi:hypothetical protein
MEIEKWILEKGVKYNQLKRAFKNNPRRIVHYYKLDNQEELFWFGEITEIFNTRFDTDWTPAGVFSFLIGGLFGIVFLGYWFLARVKSLVRNRNTDIAENDTHED